MVPQLVPVVKATRAASTKVIAGSRPGARRSPRAAIRKSAVCRVWVKSDRVQASTRMIMARNVVITPSNQASISASSDSSRWARVRAPATATPRNEAASSAWKLSALPMIWRKLSPLPVAYRVAIKVTIRVAIGTTALIMRGWGRAESGVSAVPGVAGRWPRRARRSAVSMGPKSRPLAAMANTRNRVSSG